MAGKFVDVTLRLIDKMSSPLNVVGSNLSKSAKQISRAGKEVEKAGKNIAKVGSNMTKCFTVPIAGAGVACLKLASDFETGMSKVKSIAGATSEQMDMLSEKAKEMGAKTKYSATEATEAFSYMAMAGWNTEAMMAGIEGVMYLAGATGEDLASTSDIVTDALTAFGMAADETQRFVDVLAQTANKSNTNVAMLGESFKYVAPVAGALGYNVEDVSTALGLMANSGIKASNAGTALRSWLTNMANPTEKSANAMKDLGISLMDSKGNMKDFSTLMTETRGAFAKLTEAEKAKYAATLAGKTGMSGLLAIVNASEGEFKKLSEAMYDSTGACKAMYDVANDNLQGQLTILKSTVESIGISFGERLVPYVKKAVTGLQGLAEKFNVLSDVQRDTIIKIAGIVASIGPAILIFGKMTQTIGKFVLTVGKVAKAFKTFGTISAMITSPVGIVIGVLSGIIAVTILVIKNWDKVKGVAKKVFDYVKKVFENLGITSDTLKEKIAPIGDKFIQIKDKILEFWTLAQPYVQKFGEAIGTVFGVYLGGVIGGAIGYFKSLFDSVMDIIGNIMDAFGGLIDFINGVFTGNWSKAWEGIKSIFSNAFGTLGEICKAPINAVISIINGAIAGINSLGITIPDWVPVIGGNAFNINIPTIPALAAGTPNWGGGIAQISEKGGEIVDLPSGSRVYPHDESVKRAFDDGTRSGGASTITIAKLADQIIVREEADIDKIAQKLADKLEKVSKNLGGSELGYIY